MFDAFSTDTLAALLLIIAVLNFRRIGTFINLSKIRLRSADWQPVSRTEFPPHIAHLLGCARSALRTLGFQFVGALAAEPPVTIDPRARMFGTLHWHAATGVLAAVELAEPFGGQATKVHFITAFSDGSALLTMNREQFMQLPVPGNVTVVDVYGDDLGQQWQAHRQALAREEAHRAEVHEPGEAIRHHAGLGVAGRIAHMQAIGWARADAGGHYRFTPRGAWTYAGQFTKPPAAARKALARPYRHDPEPDTRARRLSEMDAVAATIALASQPYPAWMKALLFAVTLVLSAILFGWGFGLTGAAALVTVLLVHELGHLTAMWAFGYRNLSIFFLPFLGAATTGHKTHTTPWQEAVVLLAGPVPGLMLALAATQIPSAALPFPVAEFSRSFVWFALILNLFNLLPFGVLDGGRLFELAVLGRFPYARAVFAVLGAVIGLLYALQARSVVLGLAMLLLLASTGLQFKAAGVIRAVRARTRSAGKKLLDGAAVIAALGREFARGEYGGNGARGWMQRVNIARLAYPRLVQGVPGLGVALGALTAQGTALFLPLVLVVSLFWRQSEAPPLMRTTAAERQAVERQLAEEPRGIRAQAALDRFAARYQAQVDPNARWAMLDQREQEMSEDDDYSLTMARWITRQRAELLDRLPPDHPARLARQLDMVEHGAPGATEKILAIIGELTAQGTRPAATLDAERLSLLLGAYRRLTEEAPPGVLETQAATLDALWVALQAPDRAPAAQRPMVASLRAHIAFRTGHPDQAETWMKRYRDSAGPDDNFAPIAYAWFLLDAGQQERALALANEALQKAETPEVTRTRWQSVAGWAEMAQGNPNRADARFREVLAERKVRLQHGLDDLPWWMRLLSGAGDIMHEASRRIDPAKLDHLAALQVYAPKQAAKLMADLNPPATEEGQQAMSGFNSTIDGWGKARQAAHRKILAMLERDMAGSQRPRR